MIIQVKATELYVHEVLFIMLHKVAQTLKSVDESVRILMIAIPHSHSFGAV